MTDPLLEFTRLYIDDPVKTRLKSVLQDLCARKWMLTHYHSHAFTMKHNADLAMVLDQLMRDTDAPPELRNIALLYVCMMLRDAVSGESL